MDGLTERRMLNAKQVASELGVSLRTVRSWDNSGRLPRPIRVGRVVRWSAEELARWIKSRCPHRDVWAVEDTRR